MAKYLNLPDGSSLQLKEGETKEQALARAFQKYPEAFGFGAAAAPAAQPESGFTPALKSGYSELKSGLAALAGRTGIMDQAAAEKYIAEQEEYQKRTFKPTATFGEAPVTKTLELLGGSLPYMAAPVVAGGAVALTPLTGPAATIAGLGAAGAASAGQFTGSNLRRQMEEGKALGETELAPAFGAALPQAALDMVSFRMIPGIRQLFTAAGTEVAPAAAKRIAEQGVKDIARDYTLATGKAMTAEGLTEAGQQVLERMQAGLSLSDEKARAEYIDSLIGGAVLGGALSPAGRYVERRGQAGREEEQRLAEAQAEQARLDAAKEAARAARQTPEGQAQFVAEYDARMSRFNELKALPKPGKNASPVEQAEYETVKRERQELKKLLDKDAAEYITAKRAVTQGMRVDPEAEARQAEIEASFPTDTQAQPYYAETQGTLPGMEAVPGQEAAPAAPEFVDYAAQIRGLEGRMDDLREQAQRTTSLDEKLALNQQYEKVKAALRDAELAKKEQDKAAAGPEGRIAALRKRMAKAEEDGDITAQARIAEQLKELGITDLSEAAEPEQGTIPLAPFKTKVEDRASYAARVFQPGAADIEAQEQEALAEAERQREEAVTEAERERRIAPEVAALRRIGERPAPAVGEGQVSGLVDRLVDAALRTEGRAPGRTISGVGAADVSKADALRGQLALARATDNRPRAQEIIEQLKAIGESEADTGGDMEAGQTAKAAGVEGKLSAQAIMDNRVTRMSQSQMAAFNKLADYVQTVREGDQNVAEAKKQTLRDAAERLKDTIVGLALNEMDARRAQAGLPELTTEKKLLAVSRLNGVLNEMINRGAGVFNVQETPAVTRGTLTLKSAEQRRPPAGQRLFNNFMAAANSLRAQMRNVIDEVGEIKAPEPRKAPPTQPRVSNELRMMFQGQERPVDEQFDAAFDRAKSDEDYRTLKEIQRVYGKLSDAAREEAMVQVRRVETGQPLEVRGALKDELADLARAGQSDQGQVEMFTGEDERSVSRATTANFMRFLDSAEVKKRRMQIDEARKQAEFQAKRADTIQKKIDEEEKKQQEMLAKLELAKNKSPVEAARERLASVTDKNKEAVALAKQINEQRTQVRIRIAAMVRQLDDALAAAKKKEAEVEELVDYIVQQSLSYPRNATYKQRMGEFLDQQTAASKAVKSVEKALEKARATQTRVLEDHAKDTIDNALLSEGAKAQRKIDKAQQELKAAQEQEAGAKRRLEATRQDIKPPRPLTPAEQLAALPVEGVTRVYRDTSAPEVQAKVAALRKTIGKAEEAHAKAMASGDEKAMEESIKAIESAYDKMYEVLANAPVRREERMSEAEARAFEEYEAAQRATVEKTIALFQEKAGIAPLKLTKRRTVASVKNVKTGRVETQIKKESVAQQEKRVKEEAATGKYPARALEELAKARAELKTVQDQIAYIDANPAAPRSEAKARQTAARTAAVAKRKALEAKVANLSKAQKEVVSEARVEKQAEKALKKERRRMLRNPSRVQSVIDEDEGPVVYRTSTQTGKGMDFDKLQAFVGRIVNDWKNVPTIVVARDFDALPDSIKQQAIADDVQDVLPGLYDPNTNTVYLVATNLHSPEDVVATVAHEVAGHFGLRAMLGGSYAQTMNDIYNGNTLVRERADAKLAAMPSLSREVAVEEVLADMAEVAPAAQTPDTRSALRKVYDAVKAWFQKTFGDKVSDAAVQQIVANARRYVIEGGAVADGSVDTSRALYRTKARYTNPEMERFGQDTDKVVAKQRGMWEKVKANTTGLAFETQLVDRFAGFERLAKYMEPLKGSQMLYYLRMYDQRMNFTSQAVANGAPQIVEKTRADGRKEYVIEAKEGANIKNVVQILSKAQPMVGNAEAVNRAFTMYLAALRAQRVGLAALNFGGDVTQNMLDNALDVVNRTPGLKEIFDNARNEYNAYNRDLMKFLASTGAISEELANRLAATNDYIPFYREQNGNAMLIIGGENPIRIGNIAEQPYLQELVGGDTAILDFMTSSVQNTNMLVDMGLRNLSTKNAVFELVNLNAAKIVKKADGPDVVKFKVDGEDRYAVLDTETVTIGGERFNTGVPAELLVKGMEGIPTQMPALLRVMAAPAQLLRKAVTLSPLYMGKQLFRDSLAAPIVSGANFTPVFGAIRQINGAAGKTLEQRGITGGQYLSGTNEDITKILRDLASGKPGFMTALGKLEALGMKADSLTRRAQYNSYIAQGMSEMEATLMALESMNFNKRGASPSVHMANSLIPFFNAQIQGLNVLYKAFTGQMPFNDKLKIQQKLLLRGAMIAGVSLIYAAMMEDDEAYKNATPDQKYGNWFVRVAGVDEPVKLPVPFEIGYIFKGIPEALYNTMTSESGGEDAVKAFRQILLQTIPGGSSMATIGGVPVPIPIPQALKPAIEAGLGKSFYTGRDVLSAREKELLPEEQFRANTAEVSKALGKDLGFSPIIFENLVRGYTGTLGLAFLHTLSLGAPKNESPEAAVKRLSEYPLVGGAFQPNDAGGISNAVYERFNEDIKVRNSFKKMLDEGRTAEANALLQRRGNEIMEAEIGDVFKQNMTKLTQAERAIAASNLSPDEKRKQLDNIRRIKTGLAQTLRDVANKTTPR